MQDKIEEEKQEPTELHRQYSMFREGCGYGCSENWYHRKRCIPALCFVRWLMRKATNEGYVEIDGKRYYAAEMAMTDPILSDIARLREGLVQIQNLFRDINLAEDTNEALAFSIAEKALSGPPRNCDTYEGDLDKLHSVWFDWTGTKDGQNDDGTVKLTFPEWLLAPSSGELPKESLHTIKKCRAENEAMQRAINHIVFYGGEFAANRMSAADFAAKVSAEAAMARFKID